MKSKFVIMLAIVFSFILATKSAQATVIEPPTDTGTPPEVKLDCKNKGWTDRTVIIDGVTYKFKNQGDCMSYLVTSDNLNVNEPALIVN